MTNKFLIGMVVVTVLFIASCSINSPIKMMLTSNPLPQTEDVVMSGKHIYQQYCTSCHGVNGFGDGPAVDILTQKPADLTVLSGKPAGVIAFRIARGGSVMPAWESAFSQEEIWQLTHYIKYISNGETLTL